MANAKDASKSGTENISATTENRTEQHSTNPEIKFRSTPLMYLVGVVGAAVYYISIATDFWAGVLGILKSLAWPALLVYSALRVLGG